MNHKQKKGVELSNKAVLSKPVLFLDFDGVLNHDGTFRTFRHRGLKHPLEPNLIRAVGEVIDSVDGHVVLSTAWRNLYSMQTLTHELDKHGIDADRILDKTGIGRTRGLEIHEWLSKNVHSARVAILDDNDDDYFDMGPMREWFVQTQVWIGVTDRHLQQVEHLLTKGPYWIRREQKRVA